MQSYQQNKSDIEISDTEIIEIERSDEELIRRKIVMAADLKKINPRDLRINQVKPEKIEQGGIGNCYFLATLGVILEKNPYFLRHVISIKDDKVHVRLYDHRDTNKCYVYVLDPTIVRGEKTNHHKKYLIFFLEKAFAIHRIDLESIQLSEREQYILSIFNGNDQIKSKTINSLFQMELETSRVQLEIESVKAEINKILELSLIYQDIEFDKRQQQLLHILKTNANDIEQSVLSDLSARMFCKDENEIREELNVLLLKLKEQRIDYVSGLTGGSARQAFVTLLGPNAKVKKCTIPEDYTVKYFFEDFFTIMHHSEIDDLSNKELDLLRDVFADSASNEVKYLAMSIKNTPMDVFRAGLEEYRYGKKKINVSSLLKDFFARRINWLNEADFNIVQQQLLEKIYDYIDHQVVSRYGSSQYTVSQMNLFNTIQAQLQKNKMIVMNTKDHLGHSQDYSDVSKTYKGLARLHGYEVLNCFKKNTHYFFLFRNPWSEHVPKYRNITQTIDNVKQTVLKPKATDQLSSSLATKMKKLLHTSTQPTEVAIPHSAIDRKGHGYFMLELSYLTKCIGVMTIAKSTMPLFPEVNITKLTVS